MKRTVCLVALALLFCSAVAIAQDTDSLQGNWGGTFTHKEWKDKPVSAKLVAQGKDGYRLILAVPASDGKAVETAMMGTTEDGKGMFEGSLNLGGADLEVKVKLKDGRLSGKISGKDAPGAFEMAHVEKKSPTLGAKAPAGAKILFDGTNTDAWTLTDTAKGTMWAIVDGGAMEVRKSNLMTKDSFGDQKLHLEFRTPLMAEKRGQARGNSGVYIQGRYEVQVLDSFGLPTADNECGGIYKKAVPKVNGSLPPTEWQTYDITFYAPKFDDGGKKVKNAFITVELNGIVIHDNVELDGTTPGGVSGDETTAGPLLLQDHGNKVQYRNIWIQTLE
jgi:hypothetical protein